MKTFRVRRTLPVNCVHSPRAGVHRLHPQLLVGRTQEVLNEQRDEPWQSC